MTGEITDEITLAENFMLFELENNTCQVDIICSCTKNLEGLNVKVQGKVQTYKGEKQIVADRIEDA